jgi:hypothetical protein
VDRPFDRYYPQSDPVSVCPNCEQEFKGSYDWLECGYCGSLGCHECFTICGDLCDEHAIEFGCGELRIIA